MCYVRPTKCEDGHDGSFIDLTDAKEEENCVVFDIYRQVSQCKFNFKFNIFISIT